MDYLINVTTDLSFCEGKIIKLDSHFFLSFTRITPK